jgi:hypothetical protein
MAFMLRLFYLPILVLGVFSSLHAVETVIESRRVHLGKPGSYEWEEFKDRPVDGEHLELRFQAMSNATEHTLRIWQCQVKLGWPVKLNGKKLGQLTTAETPMETLFALPAGALIEGENVLLIEAPPSLDDIEVGPVVLDDRPVKALLGEARMEVVVSEAGSGASMPCRLTLTRTDGSLQPLLAGPEDAVAARTGVVYSRDGKAWISVPAGDYVLHAGRGFEWGVARQKVTVKAGETRKVALSLNREVDTRGWIAADSHIHTLTHSGHGDATLAERMLTIAGEGIELAVSTDHNHHTDYAPAAASTRTAAAFTPVIGNEVTTKHGHFNAFPIQPGAPVVDASVQDWGLLIPAIRATPGVQVITLNHPRDLHSGFVPLGGLQFNPLTGKHRDAAALKIDAMEVITSAAMQSDIQLLYRDWFALLNRGHRLAAIGSSDSHDVNRFILGQGRTYVAAADANPAGLDLDQVWRGYHKGRLLVSLGLLTRIEVDGRFGVGDLATGLDDTLKVEISVHGPSWVQADHLALYANGLLIREETLRDDHQPGEKAKVVWKLPRPSHDVHLVAIATGPGVKEAFWEIPRPYQPASKTFTSRVIGSTNPVWIDADGDGAFESAHAIAQRLLREAGGEASQVNRDKLDAAVRVQLDDLAR